MSRVRRSSTTMALAAVTAFVLSGGMAATAAAATPVTCANFTYQEDAQAALRLNPADPSGLDPDGDGVACNSLPHRPVTPPTIPATTTTVVPTTTTAPTAAAPTSAGSAAPSSSGAAAPSSTGAAAASSSGAAVATSGAAATTTGTAPTTTPAGDTKNCSDFATQALAQAFLLADPTDPSRLDADHDGVACEDSFGTQNQQVAVIPNGAVRTGGLPPR